MRPHLCTLHFHTLSGRCGALIVLVLVSGSSGLGENPEFLGKAFYSRGASVQVGV